MSPDSKTAEHARIETLQIDKSFETKQFKYEICDKFLTTKKELKRHISSVHGEKRSFQCSICESKFKIRDNLTHKINS